MSDRNSPAFEAALTHTLLFEGGYANDPDDSGGETFRGISRVSWPNWPGWKLIDEAKGYGLGWADDINRRFVGHDEMASLVADFYYQNFWRPFAGLQGFERLKAKLFDTGVNTGVGRAVKLLQQTINKRDAQIELKVDGALGPKTKTALATFAEDDLLQTYTFQQAEFYLDIVARKPSQKKFLKTWLRRADWVPE